MTSLDDHTQTVLTEVWLPRLRELPLQRKPIIRIMIGVLLTPLVFALCLLLSLMINQEGVPYKAGACGILMGISALAFVYLGKLQSCNDDIAAIEALVYLGDRDKLIAALSDIRCLGKMQDLLRDSRNLFRGASE